MEQTIASPLGAAEIVEDACDKLREVLRRDCHLNPALAYEAYSGTIDVKLRLKDCGRMPETEAHISIQSETPITEDAFLVEAEVTIGEKPPNQVRQESGQPVPTLVTDSEGRKEIKPVRYGKHRQ